MNLELLPATLRRNRLLVVHVGGVKPSHSPALFLHSSTTH